MNNLDLDVDTRKHTKHVAVEKFRRETSQYLLYEKYKTLVDLEADWDNYNNMNRDDQRESDWRSLEIFGKDNAERYEEMQAEFLKQDIDTSPEIKEYVPTRKPITEEYEEQEFNPILFVDYCRKQGDYITTYKTEQMLKDKGYLPLAESVENDLKIDTYYFNKTIVDPIVPFFTPKEMDKLGITQNDRGGFYSNTPDNTLVGSISTKNWINEYKNKYLGFGFENTNWFDWQDTMNSLYENYIDILQSGNLNKINNRKQSILDLGWNPELPFDDKTRLFAKSRLKKKLDDEYRFQYIDLSDTNGFNMNESAEDGNKNIYIVFLNARNKAAYYTNEITSYDFKDVGISFDKSLNEIHVFNPLINSFNTIRLPYLNEDTRKCEIFMFKVPNETAINMKSKVKNYNSMTEDLKEPLFGSITVTKNSNIIERPRYVCETFIHKIMSIFDQNKMKNEFIKPEDESPIKGIRIYIGAINRYKPDSYTGSINAGSLIRTI